jgi:hypothetical protein
VKKLILALLFPAVAWAGSGSKGVEDTPTTIVNLSYAQRVMHFSSERNAISADGVILVCMAKSSWKDGTCLDAKDNNAWMDVNNLRIPGYQLVGFEYRFVGSGGYRQLLLYFKKQ